MEDRLSPGVGWRGKQRHSEMSGGCGGSWDAPLAVCVGTRGTQPPCGEPGEIIQSRHKSVVADYVCEMSPNVLRESANEFAEPPLIKELIF